MNTKQGTEALKKLYLKKKEQLSVINAAIRLYKEEITQIRYNQFIMHQQTKKEARK